MYRKLFVFATLALLAGIVFFYGENIAMWIDEHGTESVIITAMLATLMSLFPVIPYPIIGGILGAIYGSYLGSLVTWIGSSMASIIMFAFVRFGYQDWGLKLISKYQALSKVTMLFERNAFMTIFLTRLIPIVPSIIVNIYSALSRVTFGSYTIASSVGKIPSMILFATVGSTIVRNPADLFYIALLYGSFLLIVYGCYRLWNRYVAKEKEHQAEL
ncbi:putative membrane protein YdjX (TVP38/TMEM64 family) [Geomicrobium halophilum]|uniref:TVP38/TMEM64 family membrane protein n=1 Tax=Geomicrobium halophilum TaxID=549000 RepID=A0A841PQM0_9BACL|nr:TVP38/TMEM64 family protein [Geomicrobium halophilum]MBB6451167.1 putative membrane protein YdjX (TVP38/TMEM64 family) [Geomicrobium halophilum]